MPLALTTAQLATFWTITVVAVHLFGFVNAVHALVRVRTSQGAIAWIIALLTFPFVAIPLYWIFGRSRFHGYVETLRDARDRNADLERELREALDPHHHIFDRHDHPCEYVLDELTDRQFSVGNQVDLLIDGQATFDAIFQAIRDAQSYLLIQFFIIKDDTIGREFQSLLIERARAGVRIHLLYDEVGSRRLPGRWIRDVAAAGVAVSAFKANRGPANRFQINFRNHRKIVIADGRTAFVGGHNVGDEYLGRDPRFGRWRDTHIALTGPAVKSVQTVFLQDWFWATGEVLDLEWAPRETGPDGMTVLALETAPIDRIEACTLAFLQCINAATDRLWIASPYFVPDESIANALNLAALRGVDVRILIPAMPDHLLVYLAAFSYLEQSERAGVKIFRYQGGFLHQKVLLIDDRIAVVGTANLDNRSFRLNFELSMVVSHQGFAGRVAAMLSEDFAASRQTGAADYLERPLPFKLAVRAARLLAPIL